MLKVLIAEDTELNRILTKKLLLHEGFEVFEAKNGKECVFQALCTHPDLILMDLSMPILDGWCALKQIRSCKDICSTPVIALTAHAMEGDREKVLHAGFDAYMSKPIDVFHFVDQIKQHLTINQSPLATAVV